MASSEYDGGVGGKFRRRPFGRAPATPYDRPPTSIRRANSNPNANTNPSAIGVDRGWVSKIVDPASRIIARGASKFFASVFQKRLTAPPAQSSPSGENLLSGHRVPEPFCNDLQTRKPSSNATGVDAVENVINLCDTDGTRQEIISGADGLFELEQLLKQKTFTREEFDRLTDLLRSKTVEPIPPKAAGDSSNKENAIVTKQLQQHSQSAIEPHTSQPVVNDEGKERTIVLEQEGRLGSSSLHGNIIDPARNLHISEEEAISPAEVAKAYMGSQPSEVSPSTLSLRSWMSQEDTTLLTESYAKKPLTPFVASRSSVNNSRIVEYSEHGYTTPRPRGRSALYKMSRSPYFNVHQATNIKGGRPIRDRLFSSSLSLVPARSLLSDGKQALKRGSSVLDDDIGSFGPIRRIRQKSDLMPPSSERHSSHGDPPSSIVTPLDQDVNQRSASSNQRTIAAVNRVPPQSTEMARKIFQELDKLVASPREKMSETKGSGDLNAPRDLSLPSLRDYISPKQDKIKDSSPARHEVSAVRVTDEAIGISSPVPSTTDIRRKIVDGPNSDLAAISSQQPASQWRASKGPQELGSDKYGVGSASELLTTGSDKMLGKSLAIPVKNLSFSPSACKGEADVKVSDRRGPEEGVASALSPVPTLSFQPSQTPSISPQLVDGSVVKNELSSLASESASERVLATASVGRPATLEVGLSATLTAGMIKSSGPDKEDMTHNSGESKKLFGDGSGLSTSLSASRSNGSLNSSSSFPVSAGPTETYFRNMGTTNNSRNPSVSAAASIPSSNPSFQFGFVTSIGAPISIPLSRDTSDAGDSNRNSMKISPVSVSSSVAPGTSNAFSTMQMTSSALSASSMFSSISDSTSPQATSSSLLLNTTSCSSSVAASPSVSGHMNSIFGLGASGNPSTSNLSFTGNNFPKSGSHFAGTTGSIFGVQQAPSGAGTTSSPGGSVVQCGSSSGSMSGLNASSSPSFGDSPFVFTTSGRKSFGLQTGFSSTAGSLSSNSIASFAPPATITLVFSNSQPSSSSMLTSTLGSNPPLQSTGFSFGQQVSTSHNLPSFVGASSGPAFSSSGPVFSFSSVGSSTSSASPSPAQPLFSISARSAGFGSSSPGNDQMNIEDSMVDDSIQAAASSVPTFGQPVTSLSTPNFQFGTSSASTGGPSVFQFGGNHSSTVPQNPSPFQPGGSFELSTGGSFSLGSGGGDKSGRRIVKVKRDKHRKK